MTTFYYMISKKPNSCGNYSCQYVRNGKVKVCSFSDYFQALIYCADIWELTKIEKDLMNHIILIKNK